MAAPPPKPLNFKLSFASAKSKTGAKQPPTKPSKRAFLGDDDEHEDNTSHTEISGWDTSTGGAIDLNGAGAKEEKELPVIPALPNRNWRAHARRREDASQQAKEADRREREEGRDVVFGLTIVKKAEGERKIAPEERETEAQISEQRDDDAGLTEDQHALNALLSGKTSTDAPIITAQTEDTAFTHDYHHAPPAPTLSTYESTPISGFGAALLRGMGWKDGQEIGRRKDVPSKPREVKRRPALLGIGAKMEAATGLELGEWGRGKGKKVMYNPVVKRNKVTGELVSEEELKERLRRQELEGVGGEGKAGGDRGKRFELEYEDGDAGKEKVAGRDERRIKEGRRERERSPERDEKRSERDRDRDRDRDRRRDYDSRDRSRDRDSRRKDRRRERSEDHHPDSKKPRRDYSSSDDRKRRERERERDRRRSKSPDSEDRRKRRREYGEENEDENEGRKRRFREDGYRRR